MPPGGKEAIRNDEILVADRWPYQVYMRGIEWKATRSRRSS